MWKIFRRRKSASDYHPAVEFPVSPAVTRNINADEKNPLEINIRQLAEKSLLESYAPPGVIITGNGEILYIHGRTGRYLEPAPGEVKWNIYDMAREDLKLELLSAIRQANSQNSAVTHRDLQVRSNGETQSVNLTVKPLQTLDPASGLMIVVFEEISPPEALNMTISDLIPQEELQVSLKLAERIKAGNEVKSVKTKRKAKDGTIVDVWLTVTKLVDDQGNPVEIATTERDLEWLSQT